MREPTHTRAGAHATTIVPGAAVQIAPSSSRTRLRFKCWHPGSMTCTRPVALGGLVLPSHVGETQSGWAHVLCVGPGDWLIVSQESPLRVCESVGADAARQGLAIVDLTHGLASLEVRGPGTREVLSKGCGLDLHPRHFPAARCARTRFSQLPVVIECLEDPDWFELTVARSYFHYLRSWLVDAAAEFQGAPK